MPRDTAALVRQERSDGRRARWAPAAARILAPLRREGVEQGLELGEVGGLGILGGRPFLEGLLEPLGLALGLRLTGQSKTISRTRQPPATAGRAFTRHDE